MVIELTYRCNLRCPMCYQRRQEQELGIGGGGLREGELSLEEIQGLIGQMPRWALIIFTGGEPFVRRDILPILEYASRKRRCHLVTNGTLITDEMAKAMVSMGVMSIGMSIEGDQETHDRIRGAGTFVKATKAMEQIRRFRLASNRKYPLLNIKTTITADNVGSLKDIVDLAQKVGADYCTLQIMNTSLCTSGMYLHDTPDAYGTRPPPIESFDLDSLRTQLEEASAHAAEKGISLRTSPQIGPDQIVAHYGNAISIQDYTCSAPWSGINVSAYGDVYPCLNYRIGNIREASLGELWNGKRYRDFRHRLQTGGLFPACVGCCDLTHRS
jgi:MoaA/NifB/PqqE/SkfB family radical SAM enzyme